MSRLDAYWAASSEMAARALEEYTRRNQGVWLVSFFAAEEGCSAIQKNYGRLSLLVDKWEKRENYHCFSYTKERTVLRFYAPALVRPVRTTAEGSEILWFDYMAALVPFYFTRPGFEKYYPWKIGLEVIQS